MNVDSTIVSWYSSLWSSCSFSSAGWSRRGERRKEHEQHEVTHGEKRSFVTWTLSLSLTGDKERCPKPGQFHKQQHCLVRVIQELKPFLLLKILTLSEKL
jgi:hypothetical protein